jgi:flagellin-like hook-associated protein FlgL
MALKAYQQNATQAVSILQTADGAYARGQDMLIRMRALAAQSQSANLSNTERGMLDTEYQQLKSELTRLSKSTTFNGQSLMATDNIMMGAESSSAALLGAKVLSMDVNNDGYLDFVSSSGGVVYAQYNNRDGTFGAAQTLIGAPGISATTIFSGDFNGDGKMDIVLSRNDSFAIMTANGNGTFSVGSTVAVTHLDSIAVGDMDGDGKDDLVIGSTNVPDFNIRIYTSTGSGFNLTGNYNTGNFTYNIAIGDLNNDGRLDISAVQGSWVTSLIQSSSGSFTQGNVLFGMSNLWNSTVRTPQLFDVDRDGGRYA